MVVILVILVNMMNQLYCSWTYNVHKLCLISELKSKGSFETRNHFMLFDLGWSIHNQSLGLVEDVNIETAFNTKLPSSLSTTEHERELYLDVSHWDRNFISINPTFFV